MRAGTYNKDRNNPGSNVGLDFRLNIDVDTDGEESLGTGVHVIDYNSDLGLHFCNSVAVA